jgi:PAS domain S-box-containing protein
VREVSGRASAILLEVLDAAGVDCAPLVVGLDVTLTQLRDPSSRLDWDVFAQVFDRVPDAIAGRLTLEEVGERLLGAPSFEFLRRAGRLLVTPGHLYAIGSRLFSTALFMNVVVRTTRQPDGRLLVTGDLLPGYRGSEAFFRVSHGSVAALPRLLSLPPALIEEQHTTPRSGRMVLRLPRSHTLGARLSRGVRALGAVREIYRGVLLQQQEIATSLDALRTSRHEMRQLMERLPEGVIIHRAGTVAWANASAIESLGYARLDEVVGRFILDFMPAADRPPLARAMAEASPGQVCDQRVEYRVLRPDGSLRRLEAGAAQMVEFEGQPARLVVMRDVTAERHMEEQLALADRMASIGQLAAGVAHEINNPLAYAWTSLEVAARELDAIGDPDATARAREAIGWARQGTERVRAIVRDLKTLSRAEDEPLEPVDLVALLDSTLTIAANAISTKAQVERRYATRVPALASRARLGQVFLNLLLNAADAIPAGDANRHTIRVATDLDERGRVVVSIADTGSGIPATLASKVFDPFFTTKPVGEGTGLGLAVCHRLIAQLGGEIRFESAAGAGTTFFVSLPAAEASAAETPAKPGRPEPVIARGSYSGTRARLHVFDAEPALLRSVRALLAQTHDVVTVASGRQALEMLRLDRRFDAVLADLMMADVTGMDLYDEVRSLSPRLAERFVFMTGGTFTARGREFLEQVPNRCLEKPFDADALLDAVEELVPGSTADAR